MIMMMKYVYTNFAKKERLERGKGGAGGWRGRRRAIPIASSETGKNMKRYRLHFLSRGPYIVVSFLPQRIMLGVCD